MKLGSEIKMIFFFNFVFYLYLSVFIHIFIYPENHLGGECIKCVFNI